MQRIITILACLSLVVLAAYVGMPELTLRPDLVAPREVGIVLGGLMLALIVGDLVRLLKLPRIAGYAFTGLCIPLLTYVTLPTLHGAFDDPAAYFGKFRVLFLVAAGLLGVSIGIRVNLSYLLVTSRRVLTQAIGQMAFVVPGVVAYLWASGGLGRWLPGLLPEHELVVFTLLAVVATTTSPSAVYGVNAEFRADSSFAEAQMFLALLKNAIAAIAILVGVSFVAFQGAPDPVAQVAWFAPFGLAAAVATGAGIVAGLVLLVILRHLSDQVLPVAVTLAIVAALLFPDRGFAVLFGGIVAGLVVRNLSTSSYDLVEALDRSSPVYLAVVLVFVGVTLPLSYELSAWTFALGLVAVRGVLLYVGGALGAYAAGASEQVVRHLPYGTFAQALTALALLHLMVTEMPAFRGMVEAYAPVLILNLLLGTILHRAALVRTGHTRLGTLEEEPTSLDARAAARRSVSTAGAPSIHPNLDDARSLLPPATFEEPRFRSEQLNRIVDRIRQRLLRLLDQLGTTYFRSQRDFYRHLCRTAAERLEEHTRHTVEELETVTNALARKRLVRQRRSELEEDLKELIIVHGPSNEPEAVEAALDLVLEQAARACQVQSKVRAPYEDRLRRPAPGDSWWLRQRKRLHRLNTIFGPRPSRLVPLRPLARHFITNALPRHLYPAVNLLGYFRIYVWQRIFNAYDAVDEMYERTLEHLDAQAGEDPRATASTHEEAVARESEELAAFEQRLHESRSATQPAPMPEIEPMLTPPSTKGHGFDDPVLRAWHTKLEELPIDFADTERDILTFESDTRRRLARAVAAAYTDFVVAVGEAGTFLLPNRRIHALERNEQAERDRARLLTDIDRWRMLASAHLDQRLMFLAFRKLEYEARGVVRRVVEEVERALYSRLTYYPAEISERCTDVGDTLSATFAASPSAADLLDAFTQIRASLSSFVQDDALHSIQEMRETNLFAELIRDLVTALQTVVAEQRAVFLIAEDELLDFDETRDPQTVRVREIPYHEIVDKLLLQACTASFNELDLRVRSVVDTVAAGLSEVNRIISFNLDAAMSELRPDEFDPAAAEELVAEFAIGGIVRAGDNASQLLEEIQDEIDIVDRAVRDLTVEHLRITRRYLFDESMSRLERLLAEMEQDRAPFQQRGVALLGRARSEAQQLVDRLTAPLGVTLRRAQSRLSLAESGWKELQEDAGIASFAWEDLEALPPAYRRLFTPSPVEIPELFVPRPAAEDAFHHALARWRGGRKVSIALIGDLGSGKTSLLHRALAEVLGEHKMLRWNIRERLLEPEALVQELSRLFGLHRTQSVERLLNGFSDLQGTRIVVIDGIERLFLRTLDGSDAMRAFLSIVAQSPREILWVTTINTSLWNLLSATASADDHFTDRIRIGRLSAAQIEELISRRHNLSGYRLAFGSPRELESAKFFSEKAQARRRQRYFRRLHETAQGHPLLTLYYWLSSIEPGEEGELLLVRPLAPLRLDHLRHLDDDKLIGLAQLLMHERLDEADYAAVMRDSIENARRDLSGYEALNLVVREPGRQFGYRVNDVLYHDLKSALAERNLVG